MAVVNDFSHPICHRRLGISVYACVCMCPRACVIIVVRFNFSPFTMLIRNPLYSLWNYYHYHYWRCRYRFVKVLIASSAPTKITIVRWRRGGSLSPTSPSHNRLWQRRQKINVTPYGCVHGTISGIRRRWGRFFVFFIFYYYYIRLRGRRGVLLLLLLCGFTICDAVD